MSPDISETRAVSTAQVEAHWGLDTVAAGRRWWQRRLRAFRHLRTDRVLLVAIVVAVVVAATIVSPALTTVVGLLAATVFLPVVITYAVVMSVAGAS